MTTTYKASIRVPTGADYEYIELQVEDTPEAIIEALATFKRLVKVGEGLETKVWNTVLDAFRESGRLPTEHFEKMNAAQTWLIHELDKSDSRVANKEKTIN